MSNRKDVIDKIQKLLALANSSNENEAKQAAAMAQKILIKHNLTMNEVEKENKKYEGVPLSSGRRRQDPSWKFVQSLVRTFFFVEIVSSKKRIQRDILIDMQRGIEYEIVHIVFGENHNIEVAKYVIDFLSLSFANLFKQYRKDTGAAVSARNSYYLGLYQGLYDQLSAMQKVVEEEVGLVVVEDALLKQHVKEAMDTTTTKHKHGNVDNTALEAGYEQGKNLRIARGLDGNARQSSQIGVTLKLGGNQ